ncbi:hypothetical protein ACWNT8_08160 [Pigmentibacter ruber]|uniref:hypothetical protein n=1 Tax=Pigmentibacter ruber TaxID=2683196 RepID=UPI00131ABBF0|nr:hypothetical protein [Pigmentibacter ruber]BFD32756.1 hypothetical protein GTC16762_23740 [Pigmentibacter ruber]
MNDTKDQNDIENTDENKEHNSSANEINPSKISEPEKESEGGGKKKKLFSLNISQEKKVFIRNIAYGSSGIIVLSVIVNTIISVKLLQGNKQIIPSSFTYTPQLISNSSFSVVKKSIINRNIFNKNGDIPIEDQDDNNSGLIKNFDEVPCSNQEEKLPVELVGILFTGNSKTNLVTFKDSRVETADVYKEGQNIIEFDNYQIYKITGPSSVQLRNQNKKICLFTGTKERLITKKEDESSNNEEQITELDSDYVSEQIGPGFSRILNSARLVPESQGGKTIGFKIYGITSGSLFEKIKLENGDVITSVNGINLEDPAQGFKIYEALQDESTITLQIKRTGALMTKKVIVR